MWLWAIISTAVFDGKDSLYDARAKLVVIIPVDQSCCPCPGPCP